MSKLAIITIVISGSIITGIWYILNRNVEQITNFDDCVAAGYAVQESFPERCATKDGRTFTNTDAKRPPENDIVAGAPTSEPAPETDDATIAIEAVRAAATKNLTVDISMIDVIAIEDKDWPDSCLGLPDVDEVCAMMITPGYKVTLTAEQQTATYRTNLNGTMVKREPN